MNEINDEEKRLGAARAWSMWHLGSKSWANEIIFAYNNPDESLRMLEEDKNS